ncbi:MAG: Ig-like domain-containing protein [Gammaproteobacteria bacterium]|nr:Ig-like domain-containing protein [Gammaproteobacteria bacterium]
MNHTSYRKYLAIIASAFFLFGCTDKDVLTGTGTGTGTGTAGTNGTTGVLSIGTGSGSTFSPGNLEIKVPQVAVSGTTDITVYIVDSNNNLDKGTNTVNFESYCSIQGLASFTATSVTSTTGIATTTYIDKGCVAQDTVIATAQWDASLQATGDITISSSAPVTSNTLRVGTGTLASFTEGAVNITLPNIASDGSTTVSVNLVDAAGDLLTDVHSVTFSSDCEQLGKANFNSTIITTSTGTATTTYNASGCVGNDTITATVAVGSINKIATGTVTVAAANAGSIQFTSVSNTLIALQGTGNTTGLPENSTVKFTILDGNGAPVSNQAVAFSLDSTIGGITLSTYTAISAANGEVTTTIQSGTVATSVSVTAIVTGNTALATTSDTIAIATGPADQNSMSLSAVTLNPRAWNRDGVTVGITARLADRYNNPIQDGTAVLFTTELGSIQSSCTTVNGACTVNWISQQPRGSAANFGRTTILAHVEGEESFIDVNANGVFDSGTDTFTDLDEAYMDENENGAYDTGEPFVDFNGNGNWDVADGTYNGSGCSSGCSATKSVTVRDSLVLVMSEDVPAIFAMGVNGSPDNLCSDYASCLAYRFSGASLSTANTGNLIVTIGGIENAQTLPAGTDIAFDATNGKIVSGANDSVGNTTAPYPNSFYVSLAADNTPSNDGALSVDVKMGDGGNTYSMYIAAIDDTGAAGVIPSTIKLGTGTGAAFVNGALNITATNLAYQGSTAVSVNIVDSNGNLSTNTNTVNFTSSCVASGAAYFDTATVVTTTGIASVTYTSVACAGIDTIIVTSGDTAIATGDVIVTPPSAGSIQSAAPSASEIALLGTGSTTGLPESSVIKFTVTDVVGAPKPNETVNFTLDSTVGGLKLASTTAATNANGEVTATVQSGTVATSVRVTATVASNPLLSTTSSAIVIATGPPDQDSFSLSATQLNPRAWNLNGTDVTITARLADRFNNKIQDGTAVLFSTELGAIVSSCTTKNGQCSVTWTSQSPRGSAANKGRSTIIATVEGEESFIDNDANGVFSDGAAAASDVHTDLDEAFRDDNEDGSYTAGEYYIDFNNSGNYSTGDGKYNGAGCTHPTLCGTAASVTVRDSLVLVMAEDTPALYAMGTNGGTNNICTSKADCALGVNYPTFFNLTTVSSVTFTIAGSQLGQILPVGSTVMFIESNGTITAGGNQTVANTSLDPGVAGNEWVTQYTVYLSPDGTPTSDGVLNIDITVAGIKYSLPPILLID